MPHAARRCMSADLKWMQCEHRYDTCKNCSTSSAILFSIFSSRWRNIALHSVACELHFLFLFFYFFYFFCWTTTIVKIAHCYYRVAFYHSIRQVRSIYLLSSYLVWVVWLARICCYESANLKRKWLSRVAHINRVELSGDASGWIKRFRVKLNFSSFTAFYYLHMKFFSPT